MEDLRYTGRNYSTILSWQTWHICGLNYFYNEWDSEGIHSNVCMCSYGSWMHHKHVIWQDQTWHNNYNKVVTLTVTVSYNSQSQLLLSYILVCMLFYLSCDSNAYRKGSAYVICTALTLSHLCNMVCSLTLNLVNS